MRNFLKLIVAGLLFSVASPAIAQTPDPTDLMQTMMAKAKADEAKAQQDMTEAEADKAARKAAQQFMHRMAADQSGQRNDNLVGFYQAPSSDTYASAFPGKIFELSKSLKTQTDRTLKRAKKGKRVRAVYDLESEYRAELTQLGEQAARAAYAVKDADPKTAELYAQSARTLRTALMTIVEKDDVTAQTRWLGDVSKAVDQIAVLRKKPAR